MRFSVPASSYMRELTALMEKSRGLGSQTTDMALRELLNRQLITETEALFHAVDRDVFLDRRRARRGESREENRGQSRVP